MLKDFFNWGAIMWATQKEMAAFLVIANVIESILILQPFK